MSNAAPPGAPPERWWASMKGMAEELPGLVSDRLELLALELHRAGQALGQVVVLVVLAAILGLTAWLALWVSAAGALVALGLGWPLAGVAVLVVNLLACLLALARVRSLLPKLGLPATRRHLRLNADALITPTESPSADEKRPDTA